MKCLKDGHIHSHYCPHGTKDSFQMYIERALDVGLDEITFTEHMPLPGIFMDEKLLKECSPNEEEILLYLKEATKIKEEYKDKIKIKMLDNYGEYLDEGILSVHFLRLDDVYHCLDMSVDEFGIIAKILGGVEKVYDKYFETLIKSINADLGSYKPKRIGHPTLVRIFNEKYPMDYKNEALIDKVIKTIKENGY